MRYKKYYSHSEPIINRYLPDASPEEKENAHEKIWAIFEALALLHEQIQKGRGKGDVGTLF